MTSTIYAEQRFFSSSSSSSSAFSSHSRIRRGSLMVPNICRCQREMNEIQYNTPCVIKLGSFVGKVGFEK